MFVISTQFVFGFPYPNVDFKMYGVNFKKFDVLDSEDHGFMIRPFT